MGTAEHFLFSHISMFMAWIYSKFNANYPGESFNIAMKKNKVLPALHPTSFSLTDGSGNNSYYMLAESYYNL